MIAPKWLLDALPGKREWHIHYWRAMGYATMHGYSAPRVQQRVDKRLYRLWLTIARRIRIGELR